MASEMRLGMACVERIFRAVQPSERKRKGCERVLHPKGKCAEVLGSDVCSFIL